MGSLLPGNEIDCHSTRDPPKVRHASRTPSRNFVSLVQEARTKFCLNSCSWALLSGVFVTGGLLSGRFCPGWSQSALEFFPIHFPNGRLGQDLAGLWRICLCPKVARIAEQKFGSSFT